MVFGPSLHLYLGNIFDGKLTGQPTFSKNIEAHQLHQVTRTGEDSPSKMISSVEGG